MPGKDTPQYKTLASKFDKAVRLVSPHVEDLARKALSKNLITLENKDKAENPHTPTDNRASALLTQILLKIEEDERHFLTFLSILREINVLCNLADEIDGGIVPNKSSEAVPSSPAALSATRKSRLKISDSFNDLLESVEKVLKERNISAKDIAIYLDRLLSQLDSHDSGIEYVPGTLICSEATNVSDLLSTIGQKGLWNYMNYSLIESLITKFASDDNDLHQKFEIFEDKLSGFKVSTLMIHYIETVHQNQTAWSALNTSVDQTCTYDEEFLTSLSVKVGVNVRETSMKYVDALWKSLTRHLRLPKASLLLQKIVTGSVIITWLFPKVFLTHVTRIAKEDLQFFYDLRRLGALEVWINGISITKIESGSPIASTMSGSSHAYDCGGAATSETYAQASISSRSVQQNLIGSLQQRFTLLVSNTLTSLNDRGISPRSLSNSLLVLRMFNQSDSDESLLNDHKSDLDKASSNAAIFEIVKPYMSFLNLELLAHIIECLGSDDDRKNFKDYRKDLEEFCKVTPYQELSQCQPENSLECEAFQTVIICMETRKQYLASIQDFKTEILKILKINAPALQIAYASNSKEPQPTVTFLVPKIAAERVFPFTNEQERELKSQGVLSLESGDYNCILVPRSLAQTEKASNEEELEIPCLGRPFRLGMFYDCRNDNLLHGIQLCEDDVIEKILVETPHVSHSSKVLEDDSLDTKAHSLGVSTDLKLSLVSNLVQNISGSAGYWNDRCKSKNQVRVCLELKSTSCMKQLPTKKLSEIQKQTFETATHVVTGVTFGLDAYCVFDNLIQENEDHSSVKKNMVSDVNLLCNELSASEETIKGNCSVYCDVRNVSNLHETLDLFRRLCTASSKGNPKPIAKRVCLYPLKKVDNTCKAVLKRISYDLDEQLQSMLEYCHNVEVQASDLLNKHGVTFSRFQFTRNRVSRFMGFISAYKTDLTKQIAKLLPHVRGGKAEEEELAKIIDENNNSPFKFESLITWLKHCEEEVEALKVLTQNVKDIEFVSSRKLGTVTSDYHESDYVVCLALHVSLEDDTFINEMHTYLQTRKVDKKKPSSSSQPWYKNTELMKMISVNMKRFKIFAQSNKTAKYTKFVMKNCKPSTGNAQTEPSSILLYEGSSCKVWEPPGTPGKPVVKHVTHDTVQLEWSKPEYGGQSVECYQISYHPIENPQDIITVTSNSAQETVTVSGLNASTKYIFAAQSKTRVGLGTFGENSTPVETKPLLTVSHGATDQVKSVILPIDSSFSSCEATDSISAPGKPTASFVSHNSVRLTWTKPIQESGNIDNYTVSYRLKGDKKWKKIVTNSTEPAFLVSGLSPATDYVFKVRPELENGVGIESEISDPIETKPASCRPGKPSASTVTHDSITLEWAKPEYGSEKVESYLVSYRCKSDQNKKWRKVITEDNEEILAITGLAPKTSYVFKVRPELESSAVGTESEVSDPIETKELCCQPGKPFATTVTHDSITLKWNELDYNSENVESYLVFYRCIDGDGNKLKWKRMISESEKSEMTITKLTPETKYEFKVRPELEDSKVGIESEISDPIKTNMQVNYADLGKPIATAVTHNSITLEWKWPETGSEDIECYTVSYHAVGDRDKKWKRVITYTVQESVTVPNLDIGTKYVFKVQAECSGGDIVATSELSDPIETKSTSPPGNPEASFVSYNSIQLKWKKPQYGNENVDSYTIKCHPIEGSQNEEKKEEFCLDFPTNDLVVQGEEAVAIVKPLSTNTRYAFKIIPKSKQQRMLSPSEYSEPIKTKVSSPPGTPTGKAISHNSIKLEWTEPEYGDKNFTSYTVLCRQYNGGTETYAKTKGPDTHIVIKDLKIETEYIFQVKLCSNWGDGTTIDSKFSDRISTNVTSPPGKPIATDVSHNSVQLKWTEPEQGSENVQFYTIVKTLNFGSDKEDMVEKYVTTGPELQMKVQDLKHDSVYYFKVMPNCSKGNGTESESSEPIHTKPTSPPRKPFIDNVTHNRVELHWDKPHVGRENVKNYIVCHTLADQPLNWIEGNPIDKSVTQTFVDNLRPQSKYYFKIKAVCQKSDTEISTESEQSNAVKTNPICQPGKPTAVHVTHNSIKIHWDKPEHYHTFVQSYTVYYCTVIENKETDWKTSDKESSLKNELNITKLSPCTSYKFKVLPVIRRSSLPEYVWHAAESEPSDQLQTKATSQPNKLAMQSKTHDSVSLKWFQPDVGNENIVCYTVYYKLKDSTNDWTQYDTKFNQSPGIVKGLRPDTGYIFKVQACCKVGIGSESEASNSIKTNPTCKPGIPTAIRVTYNEIILRWKKPEHYSSSVQHYLVSYRIGNNDQQNQNKWMTVPIKVSNPDIVIKGLERNTVYCIKVHPVCRISPEEPDYAEDSISEPIRTKATSPPGEPKPCSVTHNSIELKWTVPKIGSEDIERYTILYELDKSSDTQKEFKTKDSEPCVVVDGLNYRTKYRFKVRPECVDGVFGTESEFSGTIENKATSPPSKPVASWTTHNSIQLRWEKPKFGSENVKEYLITCSLMDGKVGKEVKYKPKTFDEAIQWCSLDDLSPQKQYKVTIRPLCKHGTGSDSETSDPIKTKTTSPPGKPTADLEGIFHDRIQLAWKPPDINPDKVQYYQVQYLQESVPAETWKRQPTSGPTRSIWISGLQAGTKYIFKVVPKCSDHEEIGDGEESEQSDAIETTVTSPPGTPRAISKTHDSITIQWTKPDYSTQNIKEYCVHYQLFSENDDISEWKTQTQSNSPGQEHMQMIIKSLEMNSQYMFKVTPLCESGVGTISQQSKPIRTKAICKPGKVIAHILNHNSVQLEWDKPDYNGENVQSYNVECHKTGSSTWMKCANTSELSFKVTGLEPKTRYHFRVQPQCSSGIATEAAYSNPTETQDRPLAERMRDKCTHHIEEGPPCIYRVPIKHDLLNESDKIANCHILLGRRPKYAIGVQEKVLMLVGATGAGKSTLINSIVNYIFNVKWKDAFRFKLITDEVKSDRSHTVDPRTVQAESQTSWITAYTFYPEHDSPMKYALTIIDTPGFGDTRGIERDHEITKQIKRFFEMKPPEGIDQIHGIGFIVQAGSSRLTQTQKYIFESILSIFGKDIADNIFLICTFADNQPPQVLSAVTKANVPYKSHFQVNNSALFAKGDDAGFDEKFWEMNQRALEDFFNQFEQATAKSLQLTKEVLVEREKLEIHVTALQTQINVGLETYQTIQKDKEAISEHKEEINEGRSFQYDAETTLLQKVELPEGKYVTHCKVCEFSCHYPCTITNDKARYKCAAMGGMYLTRGHNAKCMACPGNCHWTEHVNVRYRFEPAGRKVQKRDLKYLENKYSSETRECLKLNLAANMLDNIEIKIKELTDRNLELITKTQKSLKRLQEIALKLHPLHHAVDYIDLMIESEEQQCGPGSKSRISALEDMKKQAKTLSTASNMKEEQVRKQVDDPEKAGMWWASFSRKVK